MRYPLLGVNITTGQWMWSKQRADNAVENYKKYQDDYASKISLKEYYEQSNGELEFVRKNLSTGQPEYWVSAKENVTADTNWFDIQAYSFNLIEFLVSLLRGYLKEEFEKPWFLKIIKSSFRYPVSLLRGNSFSKQFLILKILL